MDVRACLPYDDTHSAVARVHHQGTNGSWSLAMFWAEIGKRHRRHPGTAVALPVNRDIVPMEQSVLFGTSAFLSCVDHTCGGLGPPGLQ